ncbi:MAG: hypothetical protein FWC58_03775 [Desulfobulbus sp.]|nr:hypothetical protein [Desulfobulbus sp.]
MDYTLNQIGLYYREAVAHENAMQAAAIVAANLGASGGEKAMAAVKRLSKEA